MSKVRLALIYSSAAQYLLKALNLISVMIVVRVLTPDEMGTYAIAASVVMVVSELKSFGSGSYLMSRKELANSDVKSATGLMTLICWGIASILFSFAGFIEDIYGVPDMAELVRLLSVNFLFAPTVGTSKAILSRSYQFKEISIITVASQLMIFIATMLFLYLGFSYFSLAYAAVTGSLVELLLVLRYRSSSYSLFPWFRGLKSILVFGIYVTSANVLRRISYSLPDLIIGKLGTTTEVAHFSRGLGFLDFLSNTLIQGVSPVALPYLSEQKRIGGNLESAYLRSTVLIGSVLTPVLAVAGIASYPVIILFFGDQWVESADLVSILCLAMMFRTAQAFIFPLFISAGKEHLLIGREILTFILYAIAISQSYEYGLTTVAWSVVIVAFIVFSATTLLLKSSLGFSIAKTLRHWLPNIQVTLICSLAAYALNMAIDFRESAVWVSMTILVPVMVACWLLCTYILNRDTWSELALVLRTIRTKAR